MITVHTPGLYRLPVEPVRAIGSLERADIAVIMGYAHSGPVGVGVRVESLHQFEAIFGAALNHGFLWHAVKGYFETGGKTAYIIRLTSSSARTARIDQLTSPTSSNPSFLTWRAEASFPWAMIDPSRLKGGRLPNMAAWLQKIEAQIRDHGDRSSDPGTWANNILISIQRHSRSITTAEIIEGTDGLSCRVGSLAGLESASVLELYQTSSSGSTVKMIIQPHSLDTARQLINWSQSLVSLGFEDKRPIRIESVEFDVDIYRNGQLEQHFTALAPDTNHSRNLTKVLNIECRSLTMKPVIRKEITLGQIEDEPDAVQLSVIQSQDWTDPETWPHEGDYILTGGTDGLEKVDEFTYLQSLEEIKSLKEVALISAPDLVLPEVTLFDAEETPPSIFKNCDDVSLPLSGYLKANIYSLDEEGTEIPLPGVDVRIVGHVVDTVTDSQGEFSASGISLGLVNLRLSKPGYETLETFIQTSAFISSSAQKIILSPTLQPAIITSDAILRVQQALANPARVGPYKIAILDAPAGKSRRLDDIKSWRSQLGVSDRMGLFVPWLTLPPSNIDDAENGKICPPSGHICGAFASREINSGVHFSGANLRLRYCSGVTLEIDAVQQESLNPVGINAIRVFPGRGIRANGTRTLSAEPNWRFLTTRRILDVIEKTLEKTLQWAVFEPNNNMTRHAVEISIASFLNRLWQQGILRGTNAGEAYSVKCDLENNPETSRQNGKFIADIGVAPSEPYEFMFFRVGAVKDAIQVTETGI